MLVYHFRNSAYTQLFSENNEFLWMSMFLPTILEMPYKKTVMFTVEFIISRYGKN